MRFIDNFKENSELRKQYNTKVIDLMVAEAENKRKDIIIQELEEVVSSVRKIWIDANNEKELKIVELTEEINKLKRKPTKKEDKQC